MITYVKSWNQQYDESVGTKQIKIQTMSINIAIKHGKDYILQKLQICITDNHHATKVARIEYIDFAIISASYHRFSSCYIQLLK